MTPDEAKTLALADQAWTNLAKHQSAIQAVVDTMPITTKTDAIIKMVLWTALGEILHRQTLASEATP